MQQERLSPETFEIEVQKIRRGYYTAVYFWREKEILERRKYAKPVLMQVFQKKHAVACGIDEAIAVLKLCSGYYRHPSKAKRVFDRYVEVVRELRAARARRDYDAWRKVSSLVVDLEMELDGLWLGVFDRLSVQALYDGDRIAPWETVMTIKGLPQYFAHLESIYLGILARRTLVATNTAAVVEAAQGKPILFFADRFDHYSNQTGDGYATLKAGAFGIATDAMGEWWSRYGIGTIPHALIACFGGDTAAATEAFARDYPGVNCISLVDFQNDCEKTAVEVADHFKKHNLTLWGVRLDTSEKMVDQSLVRHKQLGEANPCGVNPILVENVRRALDAAGHRDVRIVVSGGFTAERIRMFEQMQVPTDAYGCGSSLLKGENDYTADIVVVAGRPCAKVGRWLRPNERLSRVL